MNAPTVRLRAMEPEDLDMLYTIENDVSLWDVGTTNVPYSRYTLHDYIANASGDIYADREVRLIAENADGQTIGIADIVNFDASHRRAELGLVVQQPYRRQGYGAAILASLADYALGVLHLHQLYVVVSADNTACIKLFERMGYQSSAALRQWLFDGKNYHNAVLMQLFL